MIGEVKRISRTTRNRLTVSHLNEIILQIIHCKYAGGHYVNYRGIAHRSIHCRNGDPIPFKTEGDGIRENEKYFHGKGLGEKPPAHENRKDILRSIGPLPYEFGIRDFFTSQACRRG